MTSTGTFEREEEFLSTRGREPTSKGRETIIHASIFREQEFRRRMKKEEEEKRTDSAISNLVFWMQTKKSGVDQFIS